tara:strand:+ start:201 stop:929 length:729 start_codon:yes stop_codon:yes gene_type:complete
MSTKTARRRREVAVDNLDESLQDNWLLNFRIKKPFYFNPKHKEFYRCIKHKDTKIAFVDGPAGSMKTYIAVYAGLELLRDEQYDRVVYIRSIVESAEKSLGSLPGEVDDKFSPYAIPLLEKVTEITNQGTTMMLKHKGMIDAIPVNFVRGLTFNKTLVIVDEAQNLSAGELTTILTRFGRDSKYVVCGDCNQVDIKLSGYRNTFNKFNDKKCEEVNIHTFEFGTSEIARSKILRFICKVLGT